MTNPYHPPDRRVEHPHERSAVLRRVMVLVKVFSAMLAIPLAGLLMAFVTIAGSWLIRSLVN